MDDVDAAIKGSSGLLETGPAQMKDLVELTRALRDRLSDTQINLRPVAARTVGALLSAVEKSCQAKLGRLVYSQLISAAMNDIKKPMRDASLEAIRAGITTSSLDVGGLNELALEGVVSALVAEVNDSSVRVRAFLQCFESGDDVFKEMLTVCGLHLYGQAGGLPEVLLLLLSVADKLPNLDKVVSSRGQQLGEKYAVVIIECLTSSKSETRAAALSLLNTSVENEIVSLQSIRKATEGLKPAKQRSVGPLIAKISKNAPSASRPGKENNLESENPPAIRKDGSQARKAPNQPNSSPERKNRVRDPISEDPEVGSPPAEPMHPLILRSRKRVTRSARSVIWTEFPEEPQGAILDDLRRYWAPLLPPATVSALFPAGGIKQQDDAKNGCKILSRALSADRASSSRAIDEQLDLVLKWITFALCSKETTTGLPDILSVLLDLLKYLLEINRELTDAEALETIPFIFEKVSTAKVRKLHTMTRSFYFLCSHDVLLLFFRGVFVIHTKKSRLFLHWMHCCHRSVLAQLFASL